MPRGYRLGLRERSISETRRRIVDAAVRSHLARGVEATSFQDIAREADVALGTVHRHFPNLNDLVEACTQHAFAKVQPPGPEIFRGATSTADRRRRLVSALFGLYASEAGRYIEVGRTARLDLPALVAARRRSDAMLARLTQSAVGKSPQAVRITRSLTDLYIWKALREAGLSQHKAVDVATGAIGCLLNQSRRRK
jgi:AcrR family transcriptional regulator